MTTVGLRPTVGPPDAARRPAWAGMAGLAGLAGIAAVASATVLGLVLVLVGSAAERPGRLLVGVGAVLAVLAVGGGTTALLSRRLSAVLQEVRGEAVARLADPGRARPRPPGRLLGVRAAGEVRELRRVLEALHLRVRLGDEVAERHRRTAESAGAGMAELLSGLVAAEESARGQLAAELHDTVAQSLLAARLLLAGSAAAAADPAAGRAAAYLEEAEEQVRAVMARTRPPELRRGDLATAVASVRDDLLRRYGLSVRLDWPDEPQPLSLAAAVVVYRFFQEALLNVVKHAEGDVADAQLRVGPDGLVAEVSDAGPGFDPTAAADGLGAGRHVGLELLRERARLAGGSVTVVSSPGTGTRVRLVLPRRALGGAGAGVVVPAVAPAAVVVSGDAGARPRA